MLVKAYKPCIKDDDTSPHTPPIGERIFEIKTIKGLIKTMKRTRK